MLTPEHPLGIPTYGAVGVGVMAGPAGTGEQTHGSRLLELQHFTGSQESAPGTGDQGASRRGTCGKGLPPPSRLPTEPHAQGQPPTGSPPAQSQALPPARTGFHPQSTAAGGVAREPRRAQRASPAWCRASRRQRVLLERRAAAGKVPPQQSCRSASPHPFLPRANAGLTWATQKGAAPLPPAERRYS